MDREQMIRAMAQALSDRDEYLRIAEDAKIKAEEAQSLAWELQLKLFESPGLSMPTQTPREEPEDYGSDEDAPLPSIIDRVYWAFKVPRTVPAVMQLLKLKRGQVQTALGVLVDRGRIRRRSRGVYVMTKKEAK